MKDRILYLDILRALAVLVMVQGHTVDTFLADAYRTYESTAYMTWSVFRGFTAPVFMFTSGLVFTYLLFLGEKGKANPRIKKGLKRFALLLGLGYLLRYPTYRIYDLWNVTEGQWRIFTAADALHLIGFGILFIVAIYTLSKKTGINFRYLTIAAALFFIIGYVFTAGVNWLEIFPLPIAAYFNKDTGSIFPLFPYAGYVLAGGLAGSLIADSPGVYKKKNFPLYFLAAGAGSLVLSLAIYFTEIFNPSSYWYAGPHLTFFRLSAVLFLNAAVSFAAMKLKDVPSLLN